MNKPIVLVREQLYEQVWTKPLTALAKTYGVSDVALGKICRRLNVPRPGLGYWAKVEAGKRPPRTPLPNRALQQAYKIRPRPVEPPETPQQIEARQSREKLVAQFAGVRVPEIIERPHRLTRRTEQYFESLATRIREASRPRRYGAPEVIFAPYSDNGRYRCGAEEGFPVTVSLANLGRALGFLDVWAKEVERLGFALELDQERKLVARKDGEAIAFHLREGYTKRKFSVDEQAARKAAGRYPLEWEWVGSNKFMFSLEGRERGTHREWADRSERIECRLPEMLAMIVEFVPLAKKLREERLEEERRRAEEERRRWAEEARRHDEKRQLDNLVKAEDEVARAEAALRFLDRLEAELRASGTDPAPKVAQWLASARNIARRANPTLHWIGELRRLPKEEGNDSGS